MGHSSLLGIDEDNPPAPGRDSASLGPSDSSDSGSDMTGIEDQDDDDPTLPVDVATRADSQRPETSIESLGPGLASDMAGTGERRSAGGDGGRREAADISVDRIVDPHLDGEDEDDEDLRLSASAADLANVADTSVDSALQAADEEDEDGDS